MMNDLPPLENGDGPDPYGEDRSEPPMPALPDAAALPIPLDGAGQEADPIPHNIDAEQQLLGAILTNNDIFDRVASFLQPEHFHDPVHARIYEVASAQIAKGRRASPVTVKTFLEDEPGLQELGGAAYLARIGAAAIAAFAARDYAQIIYDLAIRRELMSLGKDITAKAAKVDVASEPRDQIVEAEQQLYKLSESGKSENRLPILPQSCDRCGKRGQCGLSAGRRPCRRVNRADGHGQEAGRPAPL